MHHGRESSSSTCKLSSDEDVVQATEDESLKVVDGPEQHLRYIHCSNINNWIRYTDTDR